LGQPRPVIWEELGGIGKERPSETATALTKLIEKPSRKGRDVYEGPRKNCPRQTQQRKNLRAGGTQPLLEVMRWMSLPWVEKVGPTASFIAL